MTPPRPLPAAEKQRRYRERQKRGSISVRVDVPPQAIPALVALGLLDEHQPGVRQAIRAAVERYISETLVGRGSDG